MSVKELWFSDEIIRDYMLLLQKRYKRENICYADCFITVLTHSKIKNGDDEGIEQFCTGMHKDCRLDLKDKWIVPFSMDNVHWVLCIVMIQHHKLLIYDSMETTERLMYTDILSYVDKIRDFLVLYGNINGIQHFINVPWLSSMVPFHDIQKDKYTCATQILLVAHIATMTRDNMVPYDIMIRNARKLHHTLWDMYYGDKSTQSAGVSTTHTLILLDVDDLKSTHQLDWSEFSSKEYFDVIGESDRVNSMDINILHHPIKRVTTHGSMMDTTYAGDKMVQNLSVLTEKRNLYTDRAATSANTGFNVPSYIKLATITRDSFGFLNYSNFLTISRNIMDFIADISPQTQEIQIYNTICFDNNPLLLEVAFSQHWQEKKRESMDLSLNFQSHLDQVTCVVPFHDYQKQHIMDILDKNRDQIHSLIDLNDAIYCLKNVYPHVIVNLWTVVDDWLLCSNRRGKHALKLLFCSSDCKYLSTYRKEVMTSRHNIWLVVMVVIDKDDALCFQILRRENEDRAPSHKNRKNDPGTPRDLDIIKELLYPIDKKERIDRLWQKCKLSHLCNQKEGRKRKRLSVI